MEIDTLKKHVYAKLHNYSVPVIDNLWYTPLFRF